jgi:hypothetical protein
MTLAAFDSRLGTTQGRIRPAHAPPASGEHVFVLGSDAPGHHARLNPGDRAEVYQEVDLTGVDLFRVHLHLRVPDDVPAGLAWEASLVVDGRKLARATCRPGRSRTLTDLAAHVSKLTGVHRVGVRLQLIEV